MLERRDPDLVSILKDTNNLILNSSYSLTEIIFKLTPKIQENSETLRKQFDEALQNTNYYKGEEIKEKVSYLQKERDFLISQAEVDKNMLREKITQLENENKIMTDKIIRKAKDAIQDSIQYDGFRNLPTNNNNQNNINISRVIPSNNNINNINFPNMQTNSNYSDDNININKSNFISNNESNILNLNKSKSNILVGPVNCRVLTKKMLLEIIQEIYESKTQFDKKCNDTNTPRETMEQHMYTYLNHKYGLKNLIIEWASSIINGIRMFSAEDSEVCLFGKILRNELEEESRFVVTRMKTTISDLLTYFLKAKFPLKIGSEIKSMAEGRMIGILNEDEWKGIVYNVYEKEDADVLDEKIMEIIRKNLGIIKQNKMNR